MLRTFKYRLYPNRRQAQALDFLLWQGRRLYNAALEQRITTYQETQKGISFPAQWAHFRDIRRADPEGLGKLNATCVQQTLRRLDKAFAAFFRRIKSGETPGFPRFKGRDRFHSLDFRIGDGAQLKTVGDKPRLYVQNAGLLRLKMHRPLPEGAKLGQVTIKRAAGRWYITLPVELPETEAPEHTGPAVGIDVGLKSILSLSDGTRYDNPRWHKETMPRLRRAQRRLARRTRGSHRRRKAAAVVARLHERVANQRRDFWHKTTRALANTFSHIAVEALRLGFMTRSRTLARSAHDAGLGMFRPMLDYKAEEAGSRVVAVDPRHTSQLCSGCGALVPKALSVRLHRCPACGLEEDRDINAAMNVLHRSYPSARTGRSGANVG